jgi:tRNA-dihydrouridine synthase
VSVVGNYEDLKGQDLVDDFVDVARAAEEAISAHPDSPCGRAIELNLSCPNTITAGAKGVESPLCETPDYVHLIVKAVRAALQTETRLVLKLGYLTREKLAEVVSDVAEDVDAIAGINTLQVSVVGPDGRPAFRGTIEDPDCDRTRAGLSGIAIRNFALDFVRSLALLRRANNWQFDIIGMGGVMEPHDVRTLMASGADAVQTATAAANHPRFPSELLGGGRPEPSEEEKLVHLLTGALSDSRWEFRTEHGIAEELHLAPDEVGVLLKRHPEIARTSVMTSEDGRELYTRRDRPLSVRERLEQARSLLAHNR